MFADGLSTKVKLHEQQTAVGDRRFWNSHRRVIGCVCGRSGRYTDISLPGKCRAHRAHLIPGEVGQLHSDRKDLP